MTNIIEETARTPGIFNIYQKFLTSPDVATRLMAIGQHMMDAQSAYAHALMRANAEILAAWTTRPDPLNLEDERPSVAANRNEVMAA